MVSCRCNVTGVDRDAGSPREVQAPVSPQADRPAAPSSPGFLGKYQAPVQDALRGRLAAASPPLGTMLRYHMGWESPQGSPEEASSGKRLRPALCLFTCEAVGGVVEDALPAAVALELVHNFSLIHDDIQDRDLERRGRATVWSVWGAPSGVVAGNALRTVADATLYRLRQSGASKAAALEVVRTLTGRCLELVEGQRMDLNFESRLDVGPDEYLDMVSRKTGALVEAAMHMGALLGGADGRRVARLARCGRLLGLTFQARDDVLGIWGDPALLGKPIGADIRRRKKSLPVLFGFSGATDAARERLEQLYASDDEMDEDAVADVMGVLESANAEAQAQSVAEEKGAMALEEARAAGVSEEALQDLHHLAHFFAHRAY